MWLQIGIYLYIFIALCCLALARYTIYDDPMNPPLENWLLSIFVAVFWLFALIGTTSYVLYCAFQDWRHGHDGYGL